MKNYVIVSLFLATLSFTASATKTLEMSKPVLPSPSKYETFQENITADAFIPQAVYYGMKAIQTGGLATEKSSSSTIKNFGQLMIREHSRANTELMAIAKTKNIALPMTKPQGGQRPDGRVDSAPENLRDTSRNQNQGEAGNSGSVSKNTTTGVKKLTDQDLTQSVQQLKTLSGSKFDTTYASLTIEDYKNMVALYELGSKSKDKVIRAFAKKELPSLKQQLAQITSFK